MENIDIKICATPINIATLREIADATFIDYAKAVVDIEKRILGIGGDAHVDIEQLLLEQGSKQQNLWGINLHHSKILPEMVEFDSLINIRPRQNNRSRGVEDSEIRQNIIEIVQELIQT